MFTWVTTVKYDIIIIGGGIIGTASAYYLKKTNPSLSILIIEQFPRTGMGNTSKSAALYRNIFGSSTARVLADNSIAFYQKIAHSITIDNYGYLWLFSQSDWKNIEKRLQKLDFQKYHLSILNPIEIQNYFNIKTSENSLKSKIYQGILGKNCGALSAASIVRYYTTKFQQLGGQVQCRTKITGFHFYHQEDFCPPWKENALEYLTDQNGSQYYANQFLFCIGAWSAELLPKMGLAPAVYPKKRQLFSLKLTDSSLYTTNSNPPALILPIGGIYIKPIQKGKRLVIGCANHLANPFIRKEDSPQAHTDYYRKVINPIISKYFPQLSHLTPVSEWAGYYSYYWPDSNPVIEKIENITWVSGTSGSGIMKGDSIGRISAAKVLNIDEIALFNGDKFKVKYLSLKSRKVSSEFLVI